MISPYKVFSRHGYGIAWISDRFSAAPHDMLIDAPSTGWEFGTRDAGAFATMSDVVAYFDWLGGEVSDVSERRERIEAAGRAIHAYETHLTQAMINGTGNLPGLRDMHHVTILAGEDNPAREGGLVSIVIEGRASADVVESLNQQAFAPIPARRTIIPVTYWPPHWAYRTASVSHCATTTPKAKWPSCWQR